MLNLKKINSQTYTSGSKIICLMLFTSLTGLIIILQSLNCQALAAENGIKLNFKDVELKTIFQFMSRITGDSYIFDESLDKKATIISSDEISVDEAAKSLETLLMAQGISLVREGRLIKAVVQNREKLSALSRVKGSVNDFGITSSTLVTHVMKPVNISAESAKSIIMPLITKYGNVNTFEKANTLVITDIKRNVERITKIISMIDGKNSNIELKCYTLNYCSALKTASQLSNIAVNKKGGPSTSNALVFPIEEKNMLAVAADPDTIDTIEKLIKKIDTEKASLNGHIRIISLNYADPQQAASTLGKIFTGSKGLISGDTRLARYTSINYDSRLKLIILTSPSELILDRISSVLKALDVKKDAQDSPIKVIRLKHAGADKLLQILKDIFVNKKNVSTIKNSNAEHDEDQEINIVSDPATNSLIITASKDRFPEIIETVNKLDIYRKQVLVEALIAEVSLSDMKEIGMELGIADNSPNSDNAVASTNFGLKQNLSSSGGLNAGLVKGSLDVEKAGAGNLNELSKIKAIIKAYQNNSKFKILSTPTILASDNEASSIIVGQVVALPEGFARDTETGRFDLTKFKYADVGINLNIIPRVSPDKKVTLQVDVNAQERLEENLYDFNIPVLTKRAAKTTITISDRETVVIGGLIREDKQKLTKKIPLLGDLPLIGKFFRSRKTVKNKTNLLIFITPHIVDQSEDMRIISQKMESRSEIAEDAAEFTSQLKKRSELKLSDK